MARTPLTNTHQDAMDRAAADWLLADGHECADRNPYMLTSENSDAYLITSWALYHTGRVPRMLHKSRGHSWRADFNGLGDCLCSVHTTEHRGCVRFQQLPL